MAARTRSPLLWALALALLCAGLCALQRLAGQSALESAERRSLDLRLRLRGPRAPGDHVAIVVIDEPTLRRAPHLLEKRAGIAQLVRAIAAARPRAIGLDLFFAEPERLLPAPLAAAVIAHVDAHPEATGPAAQLLRQIRGELSGDRELARAITDAGAVVLAFSLGGRGEPIPEDRSLKKGRFGQVVPGDDELPDADRGLFSMPELNAAAAALGLVTAVEDPDQILRAIPAAQRVGERIYWSLAVALVAAYEGASRAQTAYLGPESAIKIGARQIPLEGGGLLLLDPYGPPQTFPTYSAVDVVEGAVPLGALEGKLVLVGASFLGTDRTRTAFSDDLPGVEIHATAVANMLTGAQLRRADPRLDVALCLLLGLAAALLFSNKLSLRPSFKIAGVALLVAGHLAAAHAALALAGLWLGAVWPALAALSVGGLGVALAYLGEARGRAALRRSFASYLGEGALTELLAAPDGLRLGGERRRVSVLFSDIRGFTTLAERLTPEALIELLNLYLTPMSAAVLDRGGYLDKYIGDAVMAVFGAPLRSPDHPARALATAIAMQRGLDALAPALAERGVTLEIGVGINTGDAIVGNMGSSERFDYTAVGDAVNLASRLEGLCKTYHVRCLIGQVTRDAAPPEYRTREIDRVRVKGKGEPIAVHELLGGPEGELAAYQGLDRFAAALAAYRSGDFPAAAAAFADFLQNNPHDPVTRLYLDRIADAGGAAPQGWDGVTTFHSK
jgi:adenylate cyclase